MCPPRRAGHERGGGLRVGIVGAGFAGLAAARTLTAEGHEVVVYESTDRVGGRCETRRIGEYVFDTGVTSIAPRGRLIEPVMMGELSRDELILIPVPIYTHNGSRVAPGDMARNHVPRYAYRSGNERLPQLMSVGLDIRLESHVARFHAGPEGFELSGERYDGLILTPPPPVAEQLLAASGERRSLSQASYRPCLSVLLGYELPAPATGYHAIIEPEQRHPLTWLSIENVKVPGRAPDGCTALVAQMSPSYSRQEFESDDAKIVRDAATFVSRIYGPAWAAVAVSEVRRWKYSLPESLALFETVNPQKSKLIVAGDGLLGGRVEYAYETGVWAARMLMGGSIK